MIPNDELKTFEPWLISVAQTGSSILPWIEKPHDTDYIFHVQNKRDVKKTLQLFKFRPENECWLVNELSIQGARVYAYEYHYLQPILGTEFPDYDIFDHIDEHKQVLVKEGLGKPFVSGQKFWYHILTGIYLLDNGKYEITNEQAKNINLCHDRQMTEDIYNYIQEKLQEYKNELGI